MESYMDEWMVILQKSGRKMVILKDFGREMIILQDFGRKTVILKDSDNGYLAQFWQILPESSKITIPNGLRFWQFI